MTWLAGQINIPPQLAEYWLQLWLLASVCAWLLGRRRATISFVILAFVPLLLPVFRPLFSELANNLLTYVPWYVLLIVGFFFVFIVLRSIISLFMGPEIATRTTSDLLTLTIASLVAAAIAGVRFLVNLLMTFTRR